MYGELNGTLADLVRGFCESVYGSDGQRGRNSRLFAPYALLFLRWEQRFPAEWRTGWHRSPWTTKEWILETFYVLGPAPETVSQLADLLLATVQRWHHCQDRRYWRLARRLDNPAAVAASILMDLAPADVARVLESLEPAPAGRILEAVHPIEFAASAVGLMDVRLAARALKTMDMPAAAGEGLYWLPAEEAAALLRRLDLEFAVHVLAKMS